MVIHIAKGTKGPNSAITDATNASQYISISCILAAPALTTDPQMKKPTNPARHHQRVFSSSSVIFSYSFLFEPCGPYMLFFSAPAIFSVLKIIGNTDQNAPPRAMQHVNTPHSSK